VDVEKRVRSSKVVCKVKKKKKIDGVNEESN
jgi:hypothetical protein